ncbi:MAG: hypothetical protein KGZ69_13515 [Methylomonas sp.]|nr:hypothetical protein [Methylomonas sp.]
MSKLKFATVQPPNREPVENREATPETLRHFRKDVILRLFERGDLDRHHLDAVDELRRVWNAVDRALFPASRAYERRDYDVPRRYGGLLMAERMREDDYRIWRYRYVSWAAEMGMLLPARRRLIWLQLIREIVVDNLAPGQIEILYGLPRGRRMVSKYLRAGLDKYCRAAGIRDVVGGSQSVPAKNTRYG